MGPLGHTVVSLGIGAGVWGATGSALAVPASMATGVLIDADHVLDSYITYVKKDRRRVFVLFHAWEYAILGLAMVIGVWQHSVLLAGVLGYLGHLVGDQIANRPTHPLAYSIIYRMRSGFERSRLFQEAPDTLSQLLHGTIPLWRVIEPRLLDLASRFRSSGA